MRPVKELENVARTLLTALCGATALGAGIAGALVLALAGLAAMLLMVLYGLIASRALPRD
jgi:hypothetical protein